MRVRCGGWMMALLLGVAGSLPAQQPVTTLRTTTRLVVLDVVVNDHYGVPAKGLQQSDFMLTEDGVPQKLVSFTEHDGTPPPQPVPSESLPANTFAVQPRVALEGASTVIVLDNVSMHDTVYLGKQLREYLLSAPLSMPIALFKRQQNQIYLVQELTANRQLLLDAVESERFKKQVYHDPLDHPGVAPGTGPLTLYQYMRGVPGRVNLVWFGGAGQTFPDVPRNDGTVDDPHLVLRLSRVALYSIDAHGLVAPDTGTAGPLGVIATYGTSGGSSLADRGAAMTLAEKSGGKSFFNNGFKDDLAEVTRTGAHFYTLSYSPTNRNWNGAYRKIDVNVSGYSVPSGWTWGKFLHTADETRVQYRRGYTASASPAGMAAPKPMFPSAAESDAPPPERRLLSVSPRGTPPRLRPQPDTMQRAMEFALQEPAQIFFTATLTPANDLQQGAAPSLIAGFQDQPFRIVHMHYRMPPSAEESFQFVAVVYRDDGVAVSSIQTPGHLASGPAQGKPLGFDQEIAVPVRGIYFLRVGVRELASGRIGALEVPLEEIKLPHPAKNGTVTAHVR